jgi:hypothetical protein
MRIGLLMLGDAPADSATELPPTRIVSPAPTIERSGPGVPKSVGSRWAKAVPLIGSEESASYNGPHPNRLLAFLSETKLLSSRSIGQVARQWAEH